MGMDLCGSILLSSASSVPKF